MEMEIADVLDLYHGCTNRILIVVLCVLIFALPSAALNISADTVTSRCVLMTKRVLQKHNLGDNLTCFHS